MPEYEENVVTEAEVQKLHRTFQRATRERKIGRWYAYRSYAALARAQAAGYHWGYQCSSLETGSIVRCTCGITIEKSEVNQDPVITDLGLQLSQIQQVRGHRTLPSQEEEAVALIVGMNYQLDGSPTRSDAYCQQCLDVVQAVVHAEAQAFVERHNRSCKR
jgi:hypothetical protein